jgi:hypothetical protein
MGTIKIQSRANEREGQERPNKPPCDTLTSRFQIYNFCFHMIANIRVSYCMAGNIA